LDEIEKAHPDVFNILLQVLDEGHLTDNYGRQIDFKNTVVIMTSNVGARDILQGKSLGFHVGDGTRDLQQMTDTVKEEIGKVFNPEFLNRLDDVIVFHPLDREHIARIVEVMLRDVTRRLGDRVTLTTAALAFLAERGYDQSYGARPLKRALQRFIEDPLSERILAGDFTTGDEIEVDVASEGDRLSFRALTGTES
ncbi:MAG: NDP-hexose 4-ketoreductase, partial [Gemmatimonadetes bacterium HGW-Gemmatimonadetes-1]